MSTKESNNQSIRIANDMVVVLTQDLSEELVLGLGDGLDHVLTITTVIEEGPPLA